MLLVLARGQDVPVVLDAPVALACAALTMGLTTVSGLAAIRSLRHADPASLLR
jgi:putative ABC transport system permease protein